jgi:hypothetical protein
MNWRLNSVTFPDEQIIDLEALLHDARVESPSDVDAHL